MSTRGRALLVALLLVVPAGCDGGGEPASSPAGSPDAPTSTGPADQPSPPPRAWERRASAPGPRQEVAATVLQGKVWVLGGLDLGGASTRVEAYDPAGDRWERGPDLPVALHHAMAATYRGEVVVVGGFAGAGDDLYGSPSDRVLALRNGAWVDLPRLARPRGAGAAAGAGDALVVVGGRDRTQLIGPTEVFDGTGWRDRAPLPVPRDHLAAVADGPFVYAVGGRLLDAAKTSGDFERYDPTTGVWQPLPDLPTARGGLGAATAGGRIVVAGGEDDRKVFSEVEAFDLSDPSGGRWSSLPPMVTPRHGLGAGGVDGQVFALLGGTFAGVAPSSVTEVLS